MKIREYLEFYNIIIHNACQYSLEFETQTYYVHGDSCELFYEIIVDITCLSRDV